MVFSSIPAYLDPANWQQQQNHPHHHPHQHPTDSTSSGANTHLLPPPPPPPPPPPNPHVGGSTTGSIRPGSMADRARMANLPLPEMALKCPRCESTNTKFCYFNNYSLTQPRHFCKTCRRYWTRGGALRNVPVGGGCRRNKRSKGSSSKSPVSGDRQTGGGGSSNSATPSNSSGTADNSMIGLGPQIPPLRFMAPNLHHHLSDHHHYGEIGLNYSGINIPSQMAGATGDHINFLMGNSSSGGGSFLSSAGMEQWRLPQTQQFPFFGGLDPSTPSLLYQVEGGLDPSNYVGGGVGQVRPKTVASSGVSTQLLPPPVKMEDNQELNLSRQFLGINQGNDQYWTSGGTSSAWTDLSGFGSSSSTSHHHL